MAKKRRRIEEILYGGGGDTEDSDTNKIFEEVTGETESKSKGRSIESILYAGAPDEEITPSQEAAEKEKEKGKNIFEKAAETVGGVISAVGKAKGKIFGEKEEKPPVEFSEVSDLTDIEFEETRVDKVLRARQELFSTEARLDTLEKELALLPEKPPKGSEVEKRFNELNSERESLNKDARAYRAFVERPTDDLEFFLEVERVRRDLPKDYKEPGLLGQIKDGLNVGVHTMDTGIAQALQLAGKAIGVKEIQDLGRAYEKRIKQNIANHPEWQRPTEAYSKTDPEMYARIVAEGAPILLGGIAVGIATAGTGVPFAGAVGAFSFTGAVEGGLTYDEAKQMGASDEVATQSAAVVGVVNGVLETIGIGKILSAVPGGKQMKGTLLRTISGKLMKVMTDAGVESITELSQEVVSNAVAESYDEDREIFDNIYEASVGGLLLGGGASAVVSTVEPGGVQLVPTPQEIGSLLKQKGIVAEDEQLLSEGEKAIAEKRRLGPFAEESVVPEIITEEVEAREKARAETPVQTVGEDNIETVVAPIQVSRGTTRVGEELDVSKENGITGGESMTTDTKVAESFATKKGGEVQDFTINPGTKILNHSVLEELTKDLPQSEKTAAAKAYIQENNVDVVRFDVPEGAQGEAEYRIINEKAVTRTQPGEIELPETKATKERIVPKKGGVAYKSVVKGVSPLTVTSYDDGGEGVYFGNRNVAESFEGDLNEIVFKKDLNLLDLHNAEDRATYDETRAEYPAEPTGDQVAKVARALSSRLKSKGFDGVIFADQREGEAVVFDPNNLEVREAPKTIPEELTNLAGIAKESKDKADFVSNAIFSYSISGQESNLLGSYPGETTADKLGAFYEQVVGEKKETKPTKEEVTEKPETTKVSGVEIEKPVAKAVSATSEENTISSGFHEALNNRWTIVYDGKVSDKIKNAAEATGLVVEEREAPKGTGRILTDVSLPDVTQNNTAKAQSVFNKFAEYYENPDTIPTKAKELLEKEKTKTTTEGKELETLEMFARRYQSAESFAEAYKLGKIDNNLFSKLWKEKELVEFWGRVTKTHIEKPKQPPVKVVRGQLAATTVNRFTGGIRAPLPVLSNVLIKDGKVLATDLEGFLTYNLPEGVNVKNTVVSLQGVKGSIDEMQTTKEGIKIGNTTLAQDDSLVNEFPEVPKVSSPQSQIQVTSEHLGTALSNVVKAAAKDETRPTLAGVRFEAEKGYLRLIATDGYRLTKVEVPAKIVSGKAEHIIPANQIKKLVSLISSAEEGIISVDFGKEHIKFTLGDSASFVVRNVQGNYPEYGQIVPTPASGISIDKTALLKAVRESLPVAKENMGNVIGLNVVGNKLEITATNDKKGSYSTKITVNKIRMRKATDFSLVMPVRVEGGTGLKANASFVIDALSAVEGEKAWIQFGENNRAFIITKEDTTIGSPGRGAASGDVLGAIESVEKSVGKIKPIDLPEIVSLARELTGKYPKLSRRFRTKLGATYTDPQNVSANIKLSDRIFSDPELASRVLAHEVGHVADYLEEGVTTRGNLVGKIASLNRFMKDSFGDLSNKAIRQELKDLSAAWRPIPDNAGLTFIQYRNSSDELYADAVSILMTDPYLLKDKAPLFWKGFFDYIDQKPNVKNTFFETWDLLHRGAEAVAAERETKVLESFGKGEDIIKVKVAENSEEKKNFGFMFKFHHIDRNQAVINEIRELRKKGVAVNDDINPQYALESNNYLGGLVKSYMEESVQPVYERLHKENISWEDFGQMLLYKRAINERGELANPFGFEPTSAQEQIEFLKKKLGPEKFRLLEDGEAQFRKAGDSVLKMAEDTGYFKKELLEQMKVNPSYATFQVLDYLQEYVSPYVHKQVGTLSEIANPATSTVQKWISQIQAIKRNEVKQKLVKFQQTFYKDTIEDADTVWNGRFHEPRESKDANKALMTVIEDGKPKGYYINDPYIVKATERLSTGQMNAILKVIQISNAKWFRPAFITFNTGFQTYNLMRDFLRFYKNVPSMSLIRAVKRYGQAAPASFKRAWNIPDATINEMEKAQILTVTFNDILRGRGEDSKQIDAVMEKVGFDPLVAKRRGLWDTLTTPTRAILDVIERTGNFIETLPKVAGWKELNGKMPPNELASFIRTKVGSPDFLRRGQNYVADNNLFLFSNAIKEGWRADIEVATDPRTRAGFWYKTAMVNILPKVVMLAGLYGLFGDWIKDRLEDVSEYDITNYTIIPLGKDENNKTIYMRLPSDETGRTLGAIFWKMTRMLEGQTPTYKDLAEVFSYTAGQLPSPAPILEVAAATLQYVGGQNPYDAFRGRLVIPDQEFKAAGGDPTSPYALKPFVSWAFQQLGGGVVFKSYTTEQTGDSKTFLQKVLESPVLSNVLGRWVKVSDYGQREKNRDILRRVGSEEAQRQLEERGVIDDYIKRFREEGAQTSERRESLEKELAKEVLGMQESKDKSTLKRKVTNTVKKFRIGIVKGEADQDINSVIEANTNEQKVELLREIKEKQSDDEFKTLLKRLYQLKIISEDVIKGL